MNNIKKEDFQKIEQLQNQLISACGSGYKNLELIKKILTETELLQNDYPKFNKKVLNDLFESACWNGHLDIVDYVLTSSELKVKADVSCRGNIGIREACKANRLEIVQYLLTSQKLNKHANIYAKQSEGFRYACNNNDWEIVQYLIFDFNIKQKDDMQEVMVDQVENMFKIREINQKLENALSFDKVEKNKIKL